MHKAITQNEEWVDLNDRRKTQRADLLVRVTYHTVDELFTEFARNINEGGIFIETENPQSLGTPVALQFELPGNDQPIEVEGIVVRSSEGTHGDEPPGMAIEFGDLNESARQQINALVRQLRRNG
jgi:type IV pilus assembly protein PilZ